MKRSFTLLLALLALALIVGALSSVIVWQPNDIEAGLAWNLAMILIPVFAMMVQWKLAKEYQLSGITTLTTIAILNSAIVVGSRLGAWTGADWLNALTGNGLPSLPGKTVMGGLMLMLVVFFLLQRWWRLPTRMADVLMLGLPLGAAVGRIGCAVAGCCYGIPTDSNWGICYGPGTPAFEHHLHSGILSETATSTVPIYPIQLFFTAGNLLIFTLLWRFRKQFNRPGALAFLGLSLITFQRFGLEFIRDANTNRGAFGDLWFGLKMGQWVMLFLAILSFIAFYRVQFTKQKIDRIAKPNSSVPSIQLAQALGFVTLGGFLLHQLMTLDETIILLVSTLPAIALLSRQLWQEYAQGRPVWVPAGMLSATTLLLLMNPADTLPMQIIPNEWEQWIEFGASNSIGSYKDVSRDCDGNVVDTDVIKVRAGGAEVSSNWQKGWLKFQVGLRGTFGKVSTDDNIYEDNNFRYSSLGIRGVVEGKWIGLGLGAFRQHQTFPTKVGLNYPPKAQVLPSATLRIGRPDRFFIDARLYDEPTLGFSTEPPFSMGMSWGFEDRTGNSQLRMGLAMTSAVQSAFCISGKFPFGKSGLNGSIAAYLGDATMLNLGLQYQLKKRD